MSPGNKNAKEPYPKKPIHEENKKLFVDRLLLQWRNKITTMPAFPQMISTSDRAWDLPFDVHADWVDPVQPQPGHFQRQLP